MTNKSLTYFADPEMAKTVRMNVMHLAQTIIKDSPIPKEAPQENIIVAVYLNNQDDIEEGFECVLIGAYPDPLSEEDFRNLISQAENDIVTSKAERNPIITAAENPIAVMTMIHPVERNISMGVTTNEGEPRTVFGCITQCTFADYSIADIFLDHDEIEFGFIVASKTVGFQNETVQTEGVDKTYYHSSMSPRLMKALSGERFPTDAAQSANSFTFKAPEKGRTFTAN